MRDRPIIIGADWGIRSAISRALSMAAQAQTYGDFTLRERVPPVKGHKRKFKGSKAAKRQSRGKR